MAWQFGRPAPATPAWIASPLAPVSRSHAALSARTSPLWGARPRPVTVCTPRRARARQAPSPVVATAQPVPSPPDKPGQDPRGINGTTAFYLALIGAQLLPFVHATSGLAGDITYFTVTAISCIIIGVRRAPLEPPSLSASLDKTQAIAAPFTASLFLFGTYLLLKYTSLDIGLVFNALTTFTGTLCLKESLDPVFHTLLSAANLQDVVLFPGSEEEAKSDGDAKDGSEKKDSDAESGRPPFTLPSGLSTLTALSVTAAYLFKLDPTFVFSNAIAVALCTRILSLIRPSSFLVAAGLLAGLFCYDIFWVFGSEVMVSVATQIDSPGKLLFPRGGPMIPEAKTAYPYAILGLGDVCIPGIFISLAQSIDISIVPTGTPYFTAAVSAYVVGLLTCFVANLTTNAAQPALLYLVPALIASTVGVAAVRGELPEVLQFEIEDPNDDGGDSASSAAEKQD